MLTFRPGSISRSARRPSVATKVPAAIGEANTFRVIFFILTFFSIGVLSNFKTLWQEGIGKLAAVYLREPVRLRDLGRVADLVAVLQRREAAACKLNTRQRSTPMSPNDFQAELQKARYEPLLPIEKKLIGWSLGTGLVLLGALAAINHFLPLTY